MGEVPVAQEESSWFLPGEGAWAVGHWGLQVECLVVVARRGPGPLVTGTHILGCRGPGTPLGATSQLSHEHTRVGLCRGVHMFVPLVRSMS